MIVAQCIQDFGTSYGLPASLFLGGLFGGFTHCAGMCSPFILAQTTQESALTRLDTKLLLPYHLGRMTTYIALAIMLNSVINMAFLFSDMKVLISAPLLMLAGILFLMTAFPSTVALFPWATRLQITPAYGFINRHAEKLMNNPSSLGRYGLGVLLGFMPCGLVLSALMASATANTALSAAGAMAAFTIGTIPALLLITLGGQALKQKYPRAIKRVSQGAMVISGLWLFTLAGIMLTEQ